jgi:hypothetical protein
MAGAGNPIHQVELPKKYAKDIQLRTQVYYERCLMDIVRDPAKFKHSLVMILNDSSKTPNSPQAVDGGLTTNASNQDQLPVEEV